MNVIQPAIISEHFREYWSPIRSLEKTTTTTTWFSCAPILPCCLCTETMEWSRNGAWLTSIFTECKLWRKKNQCYIQCKTISSCKHFRHQQNRNWNSVHHCIKTWQKMQKLIICNSDSLILQCFQDIFIIYQCQIMLWNSPECLKNGLKKHMFRVRQNARLNSVKIHKNYCTLRSDTSCR